MRVHDDFWGGSGLERVAALYVLALAVTNNEVTDADGPVDMGLEAAAGAVHVVGSFPVRFSHTMGLPL